MYCHSTTPHILSPCGPAVLKRHHWLLTQTHTTKVQLNWQLTILVYTALQFCSYFQNWQPISTRIPSPSTEHTYQMVRWGSERRWASRETLWRRIRHTAAERHWCTHHRRQEQLSLVAMTMCSCCSCIPQHYTRHLHWCSDSSTAVVVIAASLVHTGWPVSRQCKIPWQFPDGSRHSSATLDMLSVTHIMPVLVLNTCMDANMQFTINSFRQLFPDKNFSPTFPWILVKSLTFSRQLSNSLTFPVFPDKWSPCTLCLKKLNPTINMT